MMKMLIIPAIDIKGGRCVRLFQGRMEQETVYSDDPVSVAKKWENEGAEMLHLVDLDGAIAGIPKNKEVISSIIKSIKIPAEVGGGIRNIETVKEYISIGVQKVVKINKNSGRSWRRHKKYRNGERVYFHRGSKSCNRDKCL